MIPGNIERIGNYAFQYCTNLEKVELQEGVKIIGSEAFSDSTLKSIVIPKSLMHIGYEAFNVCLYLDHVYYNGTEEEWNTITIGAGNRDLLKAKIHFKS